MRATKGTNLSPPLCIKILKDGRFYNETVEIKMSIVNGLNKKPPERGACNCKSGPVLRESKKQHLTIQDRDSFVEVSKGFLELPKVQFKCCTGRNGHGCPFSIKMEFPDPECPLNGAVLYSVDFHVAAKGPYGIGRETKALKSYQQQLMATQVLPEDPGIVAEIDEDLREILKKLDLLVRHLIF